MLAFYHNLWFTNRTTQMRIKKKVECARKWEWYSAQTKKRKKNETHIYSSIYENKCLSWLKQSWSIGWETIKKKNSTRRLKKKKSCVLLLLFVFAVFFHLFVFVTQTNVQFERNSLFLYLIHIYIINDQRYIMIMRMFDGTKCSLISMFVLSLHRWHTERDTKPTRQNSIQLRRDGELQRIKKKVCARQINRQP